MKKSIKWKHTKFYLKLIHSVPIELGKLSLIEWLDLQCNQVDSGKTTNIPFLVSLGQLLPSTSTILEKQ